MFRPLAADHEVFGLSCNLVCVVAGCNLLVKPVRNITDLGRVKNLHVEIFLPPAPDLPPLLVPSPVLGISFQIN